MRKVSHAETVSLVTLYDDISDRSARVAVFLAVLELMKTGELTVVQEHLFDDMLITSQL